MDTAGEVGARGTADAGVPAAGAPRFAAAPVLLIAGLAGVLLLVTSGRYGHGFDELYFLMAGRDHLDWGYFDQPPLVPALAGALDTLFPGSLVALRLPYTLAAAAGIVVTALIARELGGRRTAQVLAAAFSATSGLMVLNHWIGTYVLDPFFWTLLTWLLVRWVRLRDDRLLLLAGLVTAVSLQTKFLIPAYWALIALSALVLGPRELLRRPKLWAGAAFAALATVPTLIWQATHDWPYTRMGEVVRAEFPGAGVFLRDGLLSAGVGVGVLGFLYGLWRLLRAPALRPFRFLGVAVLATFLAFLFSGGRSYYALSLLALPFAAAAVELSRRNLVRWWKAVAWPAFVLSAVVTVAALPVYPPALAERMPAAVGPFTLGSTFAKAEGQQEQLADLVGGIYAALPPEERARTTVFSEIYPFASAVEYFGPRYGIEGVYSGHRGYWYFGAPPESAENVLFLGFDPGLLRPYFTGSATVVDGLVWTFHDRIRPWAEIWPELRRQ
ncbi:ArnT family glycosyltransferase [Amycolatopsis nigrescens]|uniref:ArnT family glycosyltransferase n=1 Tax=Amycolatopsis nigrescens TaxID=381445 RepID=UPI0003755BE2|nr:glycosyltransferase family 39 protein [Amycolatopsis nigrescens]